MNSYQRLKAKHLKEKQALMADIMALIGDDAYKAAQVKFRWNLRKSMDKFIWGKETPINVFGGLYPARDTPDESYTWDMTKNWSAIKDTNQNHNTNENP